MSFFPVRLKPGHDLKKELNLWAQNESMSAAFVVSCCGSLQKLRIRLADSTTQLARNEKFEILSLQGTLSPDGAHLHISVADSDGRVWGGHLLDGCEIYTTAEILIARLENYEFHREKDFTTGYPELVIKMK
jgi:predicted DNA-binding protein with PD1-like motif